MYRSSDIEWLETRINSLSKRDEANEEYTPNDTSLLTRTVKKLLTADVFGFKDRASSMMSKTSISLGADRVCVYLQSRDDASVYSNYEWCAEDIPMDMKYMIPHIQTYFLDWYYSLKDIDAIVISNMMREIDSLPKQMIQRILESGITSMLILPMQEADTIGIMSYQTVVGYAEWEETRTQQAINASNDFLNAYVRHMQQVALLEMLL